MADQSLAFHEIVTALYQGFLRREPDPDGLQHYVNMIDKRGVQAVIGEFLESAEYKNYQSAEAEPGFVKLNFRPPMDVEANTSEDELKELWSHVAQTWSGLGESNPLWSVLTDERYREKSVDLDEITASFYQGGAGDIDYIDAYLNRAGLSLDNFKNVYEYGCGVGRVTHWLAKRCAHVHAFDISSSHLDHAKKYCQYNDIQNVNFNLVEDERSLDLLNGSDLFVSLIVLQHNPPPVILEILRKAFAGLHEDGVALFQVPIYAEGYKYKTSDFIRTNIGTRDMEMHFVPQILILNLAQECGMRTLEIRHDHCVGHYHDWVSCTFVLQKRMN